MLPAAKGQQIEPGLVGTDFWLTFLLNVDDASRSIYISSEYDCTANVEAPLLGWDTTVFVPADTSINVLVPYSCVPRSFCDCSNCGLHVATSAPALVYASNYSSMTADMTSVLPTSVLRKSYMTQTYGSRASGQQVAVVAPYDSTRLRVVLAEAIYSEDNNDSPPIYVAGDTLDTLLMRGNVYLLKTGYVYFTGFYPESGFSGTRFVASKPVAVFQGHRCTNVPVMSSYCDHLFEQTIPSDFLGCQYVIVPTIGRESTTTTSYCSDFVGDFVKVTSRDDNCSVFIDNQLVTQLNAGESYEFILTNHTPSFYPSDLDLYQYDALPLSTSSPVLVCFYITGNCYGGNPGDPAMVIVPSLEQGISRTIVPVYNTALVRSHFVNVVATTNDVGNITLDGVNIASAFTTGPPGYSFASIPISEGVHIMDADTGRFLATFYGLGDDESYAYIAGMAARSAAYNVHANTHTLCLNDTMTIAFSTADSTLGVEWHVDGQIVDFSGDTLRITFDSAGIHRIAVVVTPVGDTVWEYITVLGEDLYVDLGDDKHICLSEATECVLNAGEQFSYEWSTGETEQTITVTETNNYIVTVSDELGCTLTDSVFVEFVPTPNVRILNQTEDFCEEYSAVLYADANVEDFLWSTGEIDQTITVHDPGVYTVEASNGDCKSSAAYTIENCEFKLYFPNAFSPNGDGINDEFYLSRTNDIVEFDLTLYNRWGEIVFHTIDPNFRWDGTFGGKFVPEGIYNYIISMVMGTGKSRLFKGQIVVLGN